MLLRIFLKVAWEADAGPGREDQLGEFGRLTVKTLPAPART
jgi:hypothetical protein